MKDILSLGNGPITLMSLQKCGCISNLSRASTACTCTSNSSIQEQCARHRQLTLDRRETTSSGTSPNDRRDSNQTSHTLQDLLDSNGVSLENLFDLKALLDTECFKFTTQEDPHPEPRIFRQRLADILVRLSAPLAICHDEEISTFIELQLRTLIAAFALLHFQGVTKLESLVYDKLRFQKLGALYSTVCQQKKDGGTPICATNVYLIQVALSYLSLFGCARNREYESTKPLIEIVFSTLMIPAQQYQSSLNIFTGIQQLARIWKKREPKLHPICTMQEHVRRVTEALRDNHGSIAPGLNGDRMLINTLTQLETVFQSELARNPDSLNDWHATRNAFQLGPPEINSRYYFYGLLDCTVQLGSLAPLHVLKPRFCDSLQNFILRTKVKEFRWKAIEAILSYRITRENMYRQLIQLVRNDRSLESQRKTQVDNDVALVRSTLQTKEANAINRRSSEPISYDYGEVHQNRDSSPGEGPSNLERTRSNLIERVNSSDSEDSSRDLWKEIHVDQFKPAVSNPPCRDLSAVLKKAGGKERRIVGFSSDSRRVFFASEKVACVFELSQQEVSAPIVFERERRDTRRTKMLSLTESFLVFIEIDGGQHRIAIRRLADKAVIFESSVEGGQIRTAIARESIKFLYILISQGSGQISIYKLDKDRPSLCTSPSCQLQVDGGDFVTQISLSPRADSIAALTHRNILYVWPTGADLTRRVSPFRYSHGYYNPVSLDGLIFSIYY